MSLTRGWKLMYFFLQILFWNLTRFWTQLRVLEPVFFPDFKENSNIFKLFLVLWTQGNRLRNFGGQVWTWNWNPCVRTSCIW
jgi:hypothetical protein